MGCDIHSFAEVKKYNKWTIVYNHFELDDFDKDWYKSDKTHNPFHYQSYAIFGFLANVRNYSNSFSFKPKYKIPEDCDKRIRRDYDSWEQDRHTPSYLTLYDLLSFDYSTVFFDERSNIETNYTDFLGSSFFKTIEELKLLGEPKDVRVIFWFDC